MAWSAELKPGQMVVYTACQNLMGLWKRNRHEPGNVLTPKQGGGAASRPWPTGSQNFAEIDPEADSGIFREFSSRSFTPSKEGIWWQGLLGANEKEVVTMN